MMDDTGLERLTVSSRLGVFPDASTAARLSSSSGSSLSVTFPCSEEGGVRLSSWTVGAIVEGVCASALAKRLRLARNSLILYERVFANRFRASGWLCRREGLPCFPWSSLQNPIAAYTSP